MKSIIPGNRKEQCYVCRRFCATEEHHIFGGPDRKVSEYYGLKVNLCEEHHRGTKGVHGRDGAKLQQYLHEQGQEVFEDQIMKFENITKEEARDRFRKEFRKSYL